MAERETMPRPGSSDLREQLEGLSSAEDFFAFFELDYDERTLSISRLHILKRMSQYLAYCDVDQMSDDELYAAARERLARAYADFVVSTPLEERVFKVMARDPIERASGFVGIADLRRPAT